MIIKDYTGNRKAHKKRGIDGATMIANKDPMELKLDILEFALAHGLKIHPGKDLDGFCRRTVESGHCPCKSSELNCPCSEALELCSKEGYCTCRLFIVPELYPEALVKARKRWEKKMEQEKGLS